MQRKNDGQYTFNVSAPKKSTNLNINADLLRQAKQLNINLSQALEQHLTEVVRQAQRRLWLTENQSALDAYNSRVETQGVFGGGLRQF